MEIKSEVVRCGRAHSMFKDLFCLEAVDENGYHKRTTYCNCAPRQDSVKYYHSPKQN